MTTQNLYDLTDTWNDGGTTFTGLKLDVTDTASASGSLLLDLQVGSASLFSVAKDGALNICGSSTAIIQTESVSGQPKASCLVMNAAQYVCADAPVFSVRSSGVRKVSLAQGSGMAITSGDQYRWTSGSDAGAGNTGDTGIKRSSAGVVQVTDGSTGAGQLIFVVPTSDPAISGALWNNGGTLTISAG